MKKHITTIVALMFVLCLTFSLIGCNRQPPTDDANKGNDENNNSDLNELITEKTPFYDLRSVQYNWRHADVSYNYFIEYLNNIYKQNCSEQFYLWTPGEAGVVWYGDNYNSEGYNYSFRFDSFEVFADKDEETGELKNSKIFQDIAIYSIDWKDDLDAMYYKSCVNMLVITEAVSEVESELEVKFGKYEDYGTHKFANIYCGETCVATCYFDWSNEKITLDWCENYIKNHLFLWG